MSTETDSVPDNAELMDKAFALFPGVTDFNGLYIALHLGPKPSVWLLDTDNEFHMAKECLLEMDPAHLPPEDQVWRKDILWSWYYDVLDYLLWLDPSMPLEQRSALVHQYVHEICSVSWFQDPLEQEEQKKLARGWAFIANDDIDEIEHWLDSFEFADGVSTAHQMADIYKRNRQTAPHILPLPVLNAVAACT